MKLIKVGSAALNQTPLDWENNKKNIREAIALARKEGVSILCLPELCISGYGCEDAFHSPALQLTAQQCLQELLPDTKGIIVALGLPLLYHNGLFNTVCLVADGEVKGFVAKKFLAGDGIHYEPRWFKPWQRGKRGEVTVLGKNYPIGDYYFEFGGIKLGFEICEEAWVAERPGSDLALSGVDFILNPSASHFAFGKDEIRQRFVLEGSRAFGVSYVYSDLLGNESGRAIYDGACLIASAGKLLATGPRLNFSPWTLTTAVVDVDATRMSQSRTGSFEPNLEATAIGRVEFDFKIAPLQPAAVPAKVPSWEKTASHKEEEFTRSVALGLFDYLRKSHTKGFVLSLSGGADSASVACLISYMVDLGVAELGKDLFLERLGVPELKKKAETTQDIVRELLVCVYQATENSGSVTRNAASDVAKAVGAQFLELDVDDVYKSYVSKVSTAVKRELRWETDDGSLQNIQARVRSPGVWLIANLRNALLLSTSNRSEVAVGYATMDGDTSGGLSPLGGIDKPFIRQWLKWVELTGPEGSSPLPAVHSVNVQQPTAELRPKGTEQTDEADLMPYDLLDAIESASIRDKRSPVEVFQALQPQFSQYDAKQLGVWIERFFVLWCRNQWKRERYAPSFHVDDENLDPRTWCRFPILSGGYERELGELRKYVESL